jgi:pimeloyl-ACP methyl ester carboxylesterase
VTAVPGPGPALTAGPARLDEESWRVAAGRPVRALISGEPGAGMPEVVLVPGLGAVATMLDLLHACGAWTRATLLDLPGFGSAATARLPVRLDELTRVAAACLPVAPGPPVVLVGHSTGAQLALRAAAAEPRRVAAVVLIGITFTPGVRANRLRLVPQLRTYLYERPRELLVTLPDLIRGGRRVISYIGEARRDDPEQHLAGLRCPVVVLRGRRDALCPEPFARAIAAAARHGRAHTLPGSHNVPYTHPGAVALHLGALARAVSPGGPG